MANSHELANGGKFKKIQVGLLFYGVMINFSHGNKTYTG